MHSPSEENLNSKDNMPEPILPNIIQQSDLSGKQTPSKPPPSSWLSSLCNCFRAVNSAYDLHKDFPLLEPQALSHKGKNTLILDLDETLIHSSFTEVDSDILLSIEVNNQQFNVYVLKRPGVDEFLQKCYKAFEVVVFTASLSNYADPLLDILDPNRQISFRLFRESCSFCNGGYVKDLAKLGRDLKNVVIVDNSPLSYSYQPENAVPIRTWLDDRSDRDLEHLWHLLEEISEVDDIPKVLDEIKTRSKDLNLNSVREVIAERKDKRGGFNSPVGAMGTKFEFDVNK